MMNYYGNYWGGYGYPPFAGMFAGVLGFLLIPLILWSIFWKGWALWKAAKSDSKIWFVVLLVLNTVGILDILYIFMFSKSSKQVQTKSVSSRKKK